MGAALMVGGMVASDAGLFWTNEESGMEAIMFVPAGATSSQVLVPNQSFPAGITLYGDLLYWDDVGSAGVADGTIEGLPLGSSQAIGLASSQLQPQGIAANADFVFWANFEGGAVMRVPVDGGLVEQIATAVLPEFIGVTGSNVYWTQFDDSSQTSGEIVRADFDGSNARTVAIIGSVSGMAVNSSGVFWASFSSDGAILSVGLDGGSPAVVAGNLDYPRSLALDGQNAYWTTSGIGQDAGTVASAPLGGGQATVIASGVAPTAVAVNGSSVYWADVRDIYCTTPK